MSNPPPPCDPEVLKNGQAIVALNARMHAAETWVQAVAKMSGQRVDWHYSGGIAQVLHLGPRAPVIAAINALASTLDGTILQWFCDGASLYRRGVDTLPDGVIAVDNSGLL